MGYIASPALTLIHAPPHQKKKKNRKREEGIIWSSVPEGHLRATVNRSPESIAQGSHADRGREREQLTTRHYRLSFLWKQRKAWVWERSAMSWDVQSLISVLGNVWKGYLSMQCSQESKRDDDKIIPAESKSSRKQGDAE